MNNDLANLERTVLRLKEADYSLCNTDTLIRVNDPQEDLCDCTRCFQGYKRTRLSRLPS